MRQVDIPLECSVHGSGSGFSFVFIVVDLCDRVLRALTTQSVYDVEALSLAALALRQDLAPLAASQLSSGAWSPYVHQGPPSVFHTCLALLAMGRAGHGKGKGIDQAFCWLESVRGIESHWFWRWKFRLVDRAVSFDPLKSGWPWFKGTISWVAPTAMALLASRAFGLDSVRLYCAEQMLLDRACPTGGWNAGNSIVMGVPLDPHPDFTSMALLALKDSGGHPNISRALDYLSGRAEQLSSPYSLAWAVMALAAHRLDSVSALQDRLHRRVANGDELPLRTVALCALALEQPVFDWMVLLP